MGMCGCVQRKIPDSFSPRGCPLCSSSIFFWHLPDWISSLASEGTLFISYLWPWVLCCYLPKFTSANACNLTRAEVSTFLLLSHYLIIKGYCQGRSCSFYLLLKITQEKGILSLLKLCNASFASRPKRKCLLPSTFPQKARVCQWLQFYCWHCTSVLVWVQGS